MLQNKALIHFNNVSIWNICDHFKMGKQRSNGVKDNVKKEFVDFNNVSLWYISDHFKINKQRSAGVKDNAKKVGL